MKESFKGLMLRFPIIFNIIVLILLTIGMYFILSNFKAYQNLDLKWFFTLTGVTVALLGQVFWKLQDTKFIANATPSELNRITDSVNQRKTPILKLIFFHLIFGIISLVILSFKLPAVWELIAQAIGLSFVILWIMSLAFGYFLYEDIADFNSSLLKRKAENEERQRNLKPIASK
ncbi:hypothetical protein A9Z61_00070 [Moraxella osloensis]|nr:hypothetical protein [Moraxella osloensis]OBX57826.1 hypothetical protein A9Z61_00070 [Moraxella osloensis]